MKRYTKEERASMSIAKKLGNALLSIEEFADDPSMIFDDVEIYFCSPELQERYSMKGAKVALKALRAYYETPTERSERESDSSKHCDPGWVNDTRFGTDND